MRVKSSQLGMFLHVPTCSYMFLHVPLSHTRTPYTVILNVFLFLISILKLKKHCLSLTQWCMGTYWSLF